MSHPISTSTSTGTSALQTLLHFNRGWAQRTRAKDSKFFKRLAEKQTPKVLWFGCSDSRVPESVVMDVNPGVIFTHRNIAK
jgi:carbonic anhydrase